MKKIIYVFVILSVIISNGCNSKMNSFGLPREQYLVGGGFTINYIAPCDGAAYVVEKSSGKIAETKSLKKGELFNTDVAGLSNEDSQTYFGRSIKDLRLGLYFVPSDKIETPSDKPCK